LHGTIRLHNASSELSSVVSVENLFAYGVIPAVATGGVWAVFQIMKFSTPLQQAVLESLTQPERPPATLLNEQYLILRQTLLGTRILARNRILFATGAVAIWIAGLLFSWLVLPDLFLGFVAAFYFGFAISNPFLFIALIIITIAIFLAIIEVFDLTLSKTAFRGGGLLTNGLVLLAAYLASAIVALFFASVCADLVTIALDLESVPQNSSFLKTAGLLLLSSLERLGRLSLHPGVTAQLFVGSFTNWFVPFDFESAMSMSLMPGAAFTATLLTMMALLSMQMTSIFGLSILNVAYFIGLFLVRTDLFFREKYKYDQRAILEHPVDYLGRVVCAVAVILILLVDASAIAYQRATAPRDEYQNDRKFMVPG
jgi:hypothetical protein